MTLFVICHERARWTHPRTSRVATAYSCCRYRRRYRDHSDSTVVLRNRDTGFLYRHDSYFYYLTGFAEPEAVPVLVGGNERKAIPSSAARKSGTRDLGRLSLRPRCRTRDLPF